MGRKWVNIWRNLDQQVHRGELSLEYSNHKSLHIAQLQVIAQLENQHRDIYTYGYGDSVALFY